MTPKKICLVTASLTDQGSANAILQMMANHWAETGHQVSILTFDPPEDPYYELDASIEYQALDLFYPSKSKAAAIRNFFSRLLHIRNAIRKRSPDIVICLLEDPIIRVILGTRGLGVPVLGVVHTDPAHYILPGVWEKFRRLTFPLADGIVVLTENIRQNFPKTIRRKTSVIPNPLRLPPTSETGIDVPRPMILSVGRLIELKRHDMLLDSFASLSAKYPDWTLAIVGDGPLMESLRIQAKELDVESRVLFPGHTHTVGDWFSQSDIFVMTSLHEGFPLALCEAMAMGVPAIVTDYPAGPDAIITHADEGMVVPLHSPEALTNCLDQLMGDPGRRDAMGKAASRIAQRLAPENILQMWDDLIDRTLAACEAE
jgi:glycosyltransferase involved in cell wall biosynthesis